MATSVWMKGTRFASCMKRPLPETMPAVTVFSKPNGEPMADHPFADLHLVGIAELDGRQRGVGSILMSAMSVRLSLPMTLALYSRLSVSLTVISSAPSTTCSLVRMKPSLLMMKPEPSERLSWRGPCCCPGRGCGMKRRKNSCPSSPLHPRDLRQRRPAHHRGGADVDHRGAVVFHELREIGQLARLREDRRGEGDCQQDENGSD